MSIRRNIAANYVGQLYAALIGILLVPLYVKYMGIEAYGLVGFYTMLQGWFIVLDMGLLPAIEREAARFNGGAIGALELRRLLRTLEGVFVVAGGVAALVLIGGASLIADRWLNVQQLDIAEVRQAIILMALTVAVRWICGLYRNMVTGLERIVWLSGFNIAIATARFVLVLPYLGHVGATPTHFFAYQLMVAALETLVLVGKTYRILPTVADPARIRWQWEPIRGVMRFAASGAFASVVWLMVTQTDRFILSGLLSLTDYAYFTLAALVASGVPMLSSPIAGAILPRLTRLNAQGDEAGLVRLYRDATQLVAVVAVPIVLVLAFFPGPVLTAWTGSATMAENVASVLRLYAVGNGVLALAAFPYYLQVARGDLSLHFMSNVLFVLLFVPLLLLTVSRLGMIGAGYAWIAANLVPFLVWLPIVHGRFLKGLHVSWLSKDIAGIVMPPTVAALFFGRLLELPDSRGSLAVALLIVYVILVAIAACSSSTLRARLRNLLQSSTT
jgi:O-antigen/teichoic acid export membrane protein